MSDTDQSTPSITVDLTVADYEAFVTQAHKRPELKRRRLRSHLRFGTIMVLGLLLLVVARTRDADGAMDWGAALPAFFEAAVVATVVLLLLSLTFERLVPALTRANVRRALGRDPKNPFLGQHKLDFAPEGVLDTGEQGSGTLPWNLVQQAQETSDYLFLFIAPLQGVIVPKRGQPAADIDAVRAVLRDRVANTELSQ